MTAHLPHDPATAEIATAAARLTGTPQRLADRLRMLLDQGPPKASPRESADARREREAETLAHERAIAALRHRLAADFTGARGWELAPSPLAVRELARRSPPGNWHRPPREWLGTMFHPAFYRDGRRRAAAMIAHPLAEVVEQGRLDIEMWAAERDLAVSFPDTPSWQDPGRSVLVVFEPSEPAKAAASVPTPAGVPPSPPQARSTPGTAAPPTAPDLDALRPDAVLDVVDIEPAAEPAMSQIPTPPEASEIVGKIDMAAPTAAAPVMRPVVAIDLDGITPRDLAAEEDPDFDVVDPAELMVDEQYQRGLSPKSLALIRRIIENWSWAKFKVPTCVRVDGRLHVIDGQHTAIAAASHPGIAAVPVLIAKVPEVADRAGAFVSHATNRLQATAVQIHRAALTAGDEEAVALDAVCRGAGVRLLPFPAGKGTDWAPGETVAVVGIRKLVEKRGAERATEILSTLAAADLAPIAGDHVRLAELLLCDNAYAGGFTSETLAVALRSLTARTHAEARELAIAQRLAPWRALAAVLYRNRAKATPSRKRASA